MAEQSAPPPYGQRKNQIDKADLYMLTALWMQESPWAKNAGKEEPRVVGSVFVLPEDKVLSVDCTRQVTGSTTVHGAVRPLVKYPDKVKGCDVYLSRKPCANCVKMLVQAGVKRVMFLPLEPEIKKEEDSKAVDALFQVSEARKSFYIPNIKEEHIKELKDGKNPYGKDLEQSENKKQKYLEEWGKWKPDISKVLDWEQFEDEEIVTQVCDNMKNAYEWFCHATFGTGTEEIMKWEKIEGGAAEEKEKDQHQERTHLSRLAQMLSNRTDDPKRGVGCVFTVGKEIISIGWNGFPSKALYGNHPRGSDDSSPGVKRKYQHVIHAEQNGLFCRNQRSLKDCTVYANKIPCNECMPLLYENGARKIVLPFFKDDTTKENETCLVQLLRDKKIEVYRHVK